MSKNSKSNWYQLQVIKNILNLGSEQRELRRVNYVIVMPKPKYIDANIQNIEPRERIVFRTLSCE